jgi:hypothetical protein
MPTAPRVCTLNFTVYGFANDGERDDKHHFNLADVPVTAVAELQKQLGYFQGRLITPCGVRLYTWAVRHHADAHRTANQLHIELAEYIDKGFNLVAKVADEDIPLLCMVRFDVTEASGATVTTFALDDVPADSVPALQVSLTPDAGKLTTACRNLVIIWVQTNQPHSEDTIREHLDPHIDQEYNIDVNYVEFTTRPAVEEGE